MATDLCGHSVVLAISSESALTITQKCGQVAGAVDDVFAATLQGVESPFFTNAWPIALNDVRLIGDWSLIAHDEKRGKNA